MTDLETKDICEYIDYEDDEFNIFHQSPSSQIALIPEQYGNAEGKVMKSDAGNFAKWVEQKHPEYQIQMHKAESQLALKSSDIWLPLVFLAGDITLPIYLNIVANYIYDKAK